MNFSSISEKSLLGKVLRLPLRLVPTNMVVPILQGKLRGKKWVVGSGTHGYWLGSFELEKQRIFEKVIPPGSVVFDIGAHVGFYTLLSSLLTGPNGLVYAFEPLPRNLMYLEKHLRINHVANVHVVKAAVTDAMGTAPFDTGWHSSMGFLSMKGNLQVSTILLDELINKGEIPVPDVVKIDVEGAELKVLKGLRSVLSVRHPVMVLATHGREIHRQCIEFLVSLNYRLFPIVGNAIEDADELLAYSDDWNIARR